MKNIKFVVRVSRGDIRAPEYVQRLDRIPIQMTTNPKLALLMTRAACNVVCEKASGITCAIMARQTIYWTTPEYIFKVGKRALGRGQHDRHRDFGSKHANAEIALIKSDSSAWTKQNASKTRDSFPAL